MFMGDPPCPTLAPDEKDYVPHYEGSPLERDGAYHQGTVWPWLIGPFIDAWLKVHPGEFAAARRVLLEVLERVFDRMVSRLNADDEDGPCTR